MVARLLLVVGDSERLRCSASRPACERTAGGCRAGMWLGGGGLKLVEDVVEGLGQTGKCAGGVVAADDYDDP